MKLPERWHERPGIVDPPKPLTGCERNGPCPACEARRQATDPNAHRGVPTAPPPLTLAGILGDIDIAVARLSTIRAAVNRLPGDRELTVIRLDSMAASLRDAVEYGDRALGSWKAGS